MTREEREEINDLKMQVELLKREQEGDVLRFKELEIIKLKYEEAAMYLKVIVNIGKWGMRITGGVLAVVAWIKRSQIWHFLSQ